MCHGAAVAAFPTPDQAEPFDRNVSGYVFGGENTTKIAVLPDIYGCNPFYQGLSTHLARKKAQIFLVDPFAGLGELPEPTREAAFARRHKVRDKDFVDRFEAFIEETGITGVVGFCLGGFYVFELARRNVNVRLLGLYGFPQGLPNQDALPTPFDYLPRVTQPFTMLMGRDDPSVGPENIERLEAMQADVPAMTLRVYDGVGHNFLPLLDSGDGALRAVAQDALKTIDEMVA